MNAAARSLRLKRTNIISVVIPLGHEADQPISDPFFQEMLGYLADEITQRGYGLYLQKILPPMKDWLTNLIAANQSDGIIVIGQSTEHKTLEAVAKHYRPLVVWGGRLDRQSYCTVGTDNVAGARLAVEHLLNTGRRRILFLGDPAAPEIGLRYEGYKQALARGPKGTAAPSLVPAHLTGSLAYAAMSEHIAQGKKFDAVVGATDIIALSAIRAITAAGLRVPRDVSVVGFDDIVLAEYANPPLTTIRQDIQRGAQRMVDLLFPAAGRRRTSVRNHLAHIDHPRIIRRGGKRLFLRGRCICRPNAISRRPGWSLAAPRGNAGAPRRHHPRTPCAPPPNPPNSAIHPARFRS